MSSVAFASCLACRRDELHCHDTLIRHRDDVVECASGPACPAEAEEHLFEVACTDAGFDCRCVPILPPRRE